MSLSRANRTAALLDPAYHRHIIFGGADKTLARRLGRELEAYEAQGRLPWPQEQIVKRVERAIADRAGEVITVRMARQTGKNETEAFIENRALSIWSGIPGSVLVRTAPTYRPQIVNSKLRLEKFTRVDPLLGARVRHREGYIVEHGRAQIQFLSGDKDANVVGATASIALSVDEAHKIDRGKFEEDFGPFTASTNAPTIMWGVAADKLDLLFEYHETNRGTDRFLEFPASVWCELNKAYANHYEARVRKLGADHPVIKTQYDLVDVESVGGYLNAAQRAALFSGDHPRLSGPRPGMLYGLVVDIGGEAEVEMEDLELREEQPERDYTMAWVLEWSASGPWEPYPQVRVVDGTWWVGTAHTANVPALIRLAQHWGVVGGAVDARGVGEAVAMAVHKAVPCIEAYKATGPEVSDDCFDLLARLNTGRVQFWKADPAADPERREMEAQARHTKYQISGHTLMKLSKPTGQGSTGKHIDGIKALTYVRHAVKAPAVGAAGEREPEYLGRFNAFEGRRRRLE